MRRLSPRKTNNKSELDITGCQLLQKLLPKTNCRSEKKRKKINTKSGLDLEKQGYVPDSKFYQGGDDYAPKFLFKLDMMYTSYTKYFIIYILDFYLHAFLVKWNDIE